MRLEIEKPIRSISGSSTDWDLVLYEGPAGVIARAKGKSSRRRTAGQELTRSYSNRALEQWSELPSEVRQAWTGWANAWSAVSRRSGRPVRASGQMSYVSAASKRLLLGLGLLDDAPVSLPPPQLVSAEVVASDEAEKIRFQVSLPPKFPRWEVPTPDYFLLARVTPPTNSMARAPRAGDLRYVAGVTPASARPLPLDLSTPVEFHLTLFTLPAGRRFGYELVLVRAADGVASTPLRGEATRSEAGSATPP